jgi:maleylacetate reductase
MFDAPSARQLADRAAPFCGRPVAGRGFAVVAKEPYGYPMIVPPSIVLDPAITLSTPPSLFLLAGMKAIDHAAERLASLVIEPFTEAISIQALRLLSMGLPRVRDN